MYSGESAKMLTRYCFLIKIIGFIICMVATCESTETDESLLTATNTPDGEGEQAINAASNAEHLAAAQSTSDVPYTSTELPMDTNTSHLVESAANDSYITTIYNASVLTPITTTTAATTTSASTFQPVDATLLEENELPTNPRITSTSHIPDTILTTEDSITTNYEIESESISVTLGVTPAESSTISITQTDGQPTTTTLLEDETTILNAGTTSEVTHSSQEDSLLVSNDPLTTLIVYSDANIGTTRIIVEPEQEMVHIPLNGSQELVSVESNMNSENSTVTAESITVIKTTPIPVSSSTTASPVTTSTTDAPVTSSIKILPTSTTTETLLTTHTAAITPTSIPSTSTPTPEPSTTEASSLAPTMSNLSPTINDANPTHTPSTDATIESHSEMATEESLSSSSTESSSTEKTSSEITDSLEEGETHASITDGSKEEDEKICMTSNAIILIIVTMFLLNLVILVVANFAVYQIMNRTRRWERPPIRYGSRNCYSNSRPQIECIGGRDLASDSECKNGEAAVESVPVITRDSGWCVPLQGGDKKGGNTEDTGV